MSENINDQIDEAKKDIENSVTTTTNHIHEAKSDARYLKLEILQLAAELETTIASSHGGQVKVADIVTTADLLADFVFAEEPIL